MKVTLHVFSTLFLLAFSTITLHSSNILIIKNDLNTSSQKLYNDAVSFGHIVSTIDDNQVTYELLANYDVVILSCGSNPNPVTLSSLRLALSSFSLQGGKILVEGGDVAFASSVYPQNNGFAAKVLRMREWVGDNGGNLTISQEYTNTVLATVPNLLPSTLQITYTSSSDQDACENDLFSERFYTCSNYPDNNGIIVYPNVNTPQIIFLTFNYNSETNPADGKDLLENCLHRLGNVPIGINLISTEVPRAFTLFPNYPNPFNPSTKIKFSIPLKGNVKLIIYDISGKEVEKLVDNELAQGTYETVWSAANLATGIYFGVLQSESYRSIIKMSLIK